MKTDLSFFSEFPQPQQSDLYLWTSQLNTTFQETCWVFISPHPNHPSIPTHSARATAQYVTDVKSNLIDLKEIQTECHATLTTTLPFTH